MTTAKTPVKAVRHGVYEIGLGEFTPGDVISPNAGGTGLDTLGAGNQILGVNADGTAMESKALVGIGTDAVVHTPGVITLNAVSTNQTGNNLINQLIGVR